MEIKELLGSYREAVETVKHPVDLGKQSAGMVLPSFSAGRTTE